MIFFAFLIQAIGIALLHRSWQKPQRQTMANTIAWVIIFLTLWPWQQAVGWEFGISFWFLSIPIVAWSLTITGREVRQLKTRQKKLANKKRQMIFPVKKQVTQNILKTVIAGPIAFMASFVCATLFTMVLLNMGLLTGANQLVLCLALMLLLWAIAITWVTANPVRWQSATVLLMVALSGPTWNFGFNQ